MFSMVRALKKGEVDEKTFVKYHIDSECVSCVGAGIGRGGDRLYPDLCRTAGACDADGYGQGGIWA